VARRSIVVDGERWEVFPSGRTNVYPRDQFPLLFEHGTGTQRRLRVTRYAPVGHRSPDRAFRELSDQDLQTLFRQSQPAWTAPEASYAQH
jgi:hypothetical protein